MLNFREENFGDQEANHEIHKNIVPRKFGAIRYYEETHVNRNYVWGTEIEMLTFAHLTHTNVFSCDTEYDRYTVLSLSCGPITQERFNDHTLNIQTVCTLKL